MTFLNRCQDLKENINQLKHWQDNHAETKELNNKRVVLEGYVELTDSYKKLRSIFHEEELNIPVLLYYSDISSIVQKVADRFKKEPKNQTIVKGKSWANLVGRMDSFEDEAHKIFKNIWHEFLTDCFAGETLASLYGSVVKTDHNKPLLSLYGATYNEFESLKKRPLSSRDDFKKAKDLAKSLKNILTQIDRNVPESVERFLTAVNVHRGAPIEYLTDEVVSWLKENNEYKSYKIVHK